MVLASGLTPLVTGCGSLDDNTTPSSIPMWARIESPAGPNIAPEASDTAIIFGTIGFDGSDAASLNRRVIARTPGGGADDEIRASMSRLNQLDHLLAPAEVTYKPTPDALRPTQLQAFVFRVRSGTYDILLSTSSAVVDSTHLPIATILIRPGQAAYVGELLSAAVKDPSQPLGLKRYFVIHDSLSRDIRLARRRVPDLVERDVVNFARLMMSSTNALLIRPRAN